MVDDTTHAPQFPIDILGQDEEQRPGSCLLDAPLRPLWLLMLASCATSPPPFQRRVLYTLY